MWYTLGRLLCIVLVALNFKLQLFIVCSVRYDFGRPSTSHAYIASPITKLSSCCCYRSLC